jgi:transcription-repair coupling factor (superfamily II helicase)
MSGELTATMKERAGPLSLPPDEPAPADVMPAVLPPEGVRASTPKEIASRALEQHRVDVSGIRGCAAAVVVSAIAQQADRRVVLVTADLDSARRAADEIGFFLRSGDQDAEDTGEGDVLVFAASDTSPYADVNPDRRAAMGRMATLAHLALGRPWRVLVVPVIGLSRKVPPRSAVKAQTHAIVAEAEIDRDRLAARLIESGYLRVPVVEDPGSFAVRGALFDVWPPNLDKPVRVELYGDVVLSIQSFDPYEQKTLKNASRASISLPPAREAILSQDNVARARQRVLQQADAIDLPTMKARALVDDIASGRTFFGADGLLPAYYTELVSLLSYVDSGEVVFALDDPPALTVTLREELERAGRDHAGRPREVSFPPEAFYADEASVADVIASARHVVLARTTTMGASEAAFAQFETIADPSAACDVAARDHEDLSRAVKMSRAARGKAGTLSPLVHRIAHWQSHGLRVIVAARAETQAERLAGLLRHQGVKCRARLGRFDPRWTRSDEDRDVAQIVVGALSRGVVLPAEGFALVTEEEVFGARKHRREKSEKSAARPFLEDLRSLSVGDLVVHVEHGIGRYQGLVHKDVAGLVVDLLVVEYSGGDKLYLPVYRLNQIQKYSGGESAAAKIDRLGGATFSKTKARARKDVRKMADELLRLYAERQAQTRPAIGGLDDEYRAFEATFPFDETVDQARAIDDVNSDLSKERPMDRLVCGDVGFGKTEVALRAAFRAALAGKQVALLCPTTVLAQQHYRTFEARLRDYPVVIRAMSRFQGEKEQKETMLGLKEGKVDIVIGTHRLLSKDIHFKDLGLLIVDEEQRFGVVHKERIKQMRTNVDVLTLTATPIPRTLQMAVGGLRDLSLITTPPSDRRAVRTIVTRMDDQVLRDAVTREMSRGGQVFYVYNRVEGLYDKARRLQELVPEARIAVGHGQMTRASKEGETGALEKTMIDFVEGRYDVLCATAIVESGLDIPRANTILIDRADLFGLAQLYQLRGRVGRSKERAYCYLIVPPFDVMTDEARARIEALERHTELGSGFQIASLDLELRGGGDLLGAEQSGAVASVGFELFCQMLEEAGAELRGQELVHEVDTELSFDVAALLPEEYVSDVGVRLSLYKRLASAIDEAHVAEIAEEMENRFGPPPEDARRFVALMGLKTELRRLRVLGCEANSRIVTLHLRDDTPLDPRKILELVRAPRSAYRLTPDMRLSRRFDDAAGNGITHCEALLSELAKCMKPG